MGSLEGQQKCDVTQIVETVVIKKFEVT